MTPKTAGTERPGSVPAAVFLVEQGEFTFLGALVASTIGSLVGAVALEEAPRAAPSSTLGDVGRDGEPDHAVHEYTSRTRARTFRCHCRRHVVEATAVGVDRRLRRARAGARRLGIWAFSLNSDLDQQRDATAQAQQEADAANKQADDLSSQLDDLAQSASDAGDQIAQAGDDARNSFQSALADLNSKLSALADQIRPPSGGSEPPDATATPEAPAAGGHRRPRGNRHALNVRHSIPAIALRAP